MKLIHNDRYIRSDKKKAEFFIKHYAGVSKIDMSQEDRTGNRNLKISFREPRVQNSTVPEFTEDELREALRNIPPKGAPGLDDIYPQLLKSLSQCNQTPSSHIQSLYYDWKYPSIWRNANIFPLMKANNQSFDLLDQSASPHVLVSS